MHIVVVGGGTKNKFGNDFVIRARSEGHSVYMLSHKKYDDAIAANFSDPSDVVDKFNVLTESLEHIDIVLYNTNPIGYPKDINAYTSKAVINEKLYHHGFSIHVVIAHMLSIEALKRMTNRSKIIFMTTDVVFDKERSSYVDKVGYYGGKAYQHQLMLALAKYNDKNAICSAISPYFDYNDIPAYKERFGLAYDHIISHGPTFNGRVFECFD